MTCTLTKVLNQSIKTRRREVAQWERHLMDVLFGCTTAICTTLTRWLVTVVIKAEFVGRAVTIPLEITALKPIERDERKNPGWGRGSD